MQESHRGFDEDPLHTCVVSEQEAPNYKSTQVPQVGFIYGPLGEDP